jgi:hypothetical protein
MTEADALDTWLHDYFSPQGRVPDNWSFSQNQVSTKAGQ